jgi:hypothetical protein
VKPATHRPPSPHRHWPTPHRCRPKKHEQAHAKSSQLDRSQRAVGVGDEREDRDVRELLERLIPLAVNNLLVVPHNLKVLIHHIQTLISAPTCVKDTPEHLQDVRVCSRSGGAPPLWVVRERAATGEAEEPARETLGSLGTARRSES